MTTMGLVKCPSPCGSSAPLRNSRRRGPVSSCATPDRLPRSKLSSGWAHVWTFFHGTCQWNIWKTNPSFFVLNKQIMFNGKIWSFKTVASLEAILKLYSSWWFLCFGCKKNEWWCQLTSICLSSNHVAVVWCAEIEHGKTKKSLIEVASKGWTCVFPPFTPTWNDGGFKAATRVWWMIWVWKWPCFGYKHWHWTCYQLHDMAVKIVIA